MCCEDLPKTWPPDTTATGTACRWCWTAEGHPVPEFPLPLIRINHKDGWEAVAGWRSCRLRAY